MTGADQPEKVHRMKKLLLSTGFIAATLAAAPVFAGSTEAITGCATAPAENSNFTVRLDPTCALSTDQPDGPSINAILVKALADLTAPDEAAK